MTLETRKYLTHLIIYTCMRVAGRTKEGLLSLVKARQERHLVTKDMEVMHRHWAMCWPRVWLVSQNSAANCKNHLCRGETKGQQWNKLAVLERIRIVRREKINCNREAMHWPSEDTRQDQGKDRTCWAFSVVVSVTVVNMASPSPPTPSSCNTLKLPTPKQTPVPSGAGSKQSTYKAKAFWLSHPPKQ